MSQPSLSAAYTSPTNAPFTISTPLPTAAGEDKTQHLVALRGAVADAQDRINRELTARMDEDRARGEAAAAAGGGGAKAGVNEDKEEENYGEEVQDEE